MTVQEPMASQILRIATHPVTLLIESALSIILWMPFGIAYDVFPWGNALARWLLMFFVAGFPISAALAFAGSCRPRISPLRLAVALVSLFIGLHDLFVALRFWEYLRR